MRWKCTVAYDGTQFNGWQSQPDGNTIQDYLERRLGFLCGAPVRIHASGRTDSGVHARGQVFHFDGDWPHGSAELLKALRVGYPQSIQVISAEPVADDFHARHSVMGKRYVYQMFEGWADPFCTRYHWSLGNWRPDLEAMNRAAALLLGEHDFSAFAANPRDDRKESPVKRLDRLDVHRNGNQLVLTTEASGYLFRMVRSLAGCLVDVGIGRLQVDEVAEILASRVRTQRVRTAPAQGLFLDRVFYP